MPRAVIVGGLRTPFCRMGTHFRRIPAQELGGWVCRELLARLDLDPAAVDEVIFGNVSQPAEASNIARVVALYAGVPESVPALTVNRNCASGMEAVVLAALKIGAGEGGCYLVGGTESMSGIPFLFQPALQEILVDAGRARTWPDRLRAWRRLRPAHLKPRIGLQCGLTDAVSGLNMGETAEVLAREFAIPRREQDLFALQSHQRAEAARGGLREEILPVVVPPEYRLIVDQDNGPRAGQTLEALARLRPVFDRAAGTVTAGNSSQITDGAAALVVMAEDRARDLGLEPICRVRAWASVGLGPRRMGLGPAHAIPRVLRRAGMRLRDIGGFEINEAFAVQVLACLRALESEAFAEAHGYTGFTGYIPREDLNSDGGAIALGHPVGATGARLILTLMRRMRRDDLDTGLASLCVGGGQGSAVILER